MNKIEKIRFFSVVILCVRKPMYHVAQSQVRERPAVKERGGPLTQIFTRK